VLRFAVGIGDHVARCDATAPETERQELAEHGLRWQHLAL
jgi:hypothetical protein